MPAWRHVLTAGEIDALAAYVARAMFRGDERVGAAQR
jgi:mono/diheme cytochrome c family protein